MNEILFYLEHTEKGLLNHLFSNNSYKLHYTNLMIRLVELSLVLGQEVVLSELLDDITYHQ